MKEHFSGTIVQNFELEATISPMQKVVLEKRYIKL